MANSIGRASAGSLNGARNLKGCLSSLWWRSVRNVFLGSMVSVLPAFTFYSVAFSYSQAQLRTLGYILLATLVAVNGSDLALNAWYLHPAITFCTEDGEVAARVAYRRLHNFPTFSFLRVFGPHAIIASMTAQVGVLYGNAHWSLGVPSSDFAVYWLLNMTLVPIGHAIFEFHANGWIIGEALSALAEGFPQIVSLKVWRVGLATRLTVFFTLLAVSPLLLIAAAIRLWPVSVGVYTGALGRIGMVIAGVAGLNLLLLLLFALDVRKQTKELLRGLERTENEDLETRVNVFSPDEFGTISEGVNKMVGGLRERKRIRELFGVYLSLEVSQAILDGQVALEGESLEVSVLFCDIRGFTGFSNTRSPKDVVGRLNKFFSSMSGAITLHGGTINKFLGDGFLAVFGAPVPRPDHSRRAVEAALAMERELEGFNRDLEELGELKMEIGIGIETGEVIAGNVGSADRKEYTVIGDTVNRASRIEQLNKLCGTRILVSGRTHKQSGLSAGRALDAVKVKGIEESIQIFALGRSA